MTGGRPDAPRRRRTGVAAAVAVVALLAAAGWPLIERVGGSRHPTSVPVLGSGMPTLGSVEAAGSPPAAPPPTLPAPAPEPAPPPSRPDPATPPPVVRVTAGRTPIVDARGNRWEPSDALTGGRVVETGGGVAGTASAPLYRVQRVGVERFSVALGVPGTYAVDLALNETAPTAAPGSRVFDVTSDGRPVVKGVDVAGRVGRNRAFHVMFTVAVREGTLALSFVPTAGETMVSAVAVGFVSANDPDHLLWSDEFDGPAGAPPDRAIWTPEVGGTGWGSRELQQYSDSPANAHLDGQGNLSVTARRERLPGTSNNFTSARLITKNAFTFRYGNIVARARLPQGKGLWPGFWALGADIDTAGWPRSGEIDVIESNGDPGLVLGSVHGFDATAPRQSYGLSSQHRGAAAGEFHDYSVLWSPVGLQFSVDGSAYSAIAPADLATTAAWAFDKPFYLLISLAVGGNFPGSPDASTVFPAAFVLDSVRVYR